MHPNSSTVREQDERYVRYHPAHMVVSNTTCAIVALSRAREGMYILGNATNLAARSKMWREVTEELRKRDCLGTAFPVACQRHPQTVEHISKPGQLPRIAPDGLSMTSTLIGPLVDVRQVVAFCSATHGSRVVTCAHTRSVLSPRTHIPYQP